MRKILATQDSSFHPITITHGDWWLPNSKNNPKVKMGHLGVSAICGGDNHKKKQQDFAGQKSYYTSYLD